MCVVVRSAFGNEDICEVVGRRCEGILLDVFVNTSRDTPANTCNFTLLMPWRELGGGGRLAQADYADINIGIIWWLKMLSSIWHPFGDWSITA